MPDAPRPRVFLPVVLLFVFGTLLPAVARAHGVRVFAAVAGDRIQGRAEFVGGGPIAGARVEVLAPSGKTLGVTRTDEEGRFEFEPTEAVDHRLRVNDGSGHAGEYTVTKDELPASVSGAAGAPSDENSGSGHNATDNAALATQVGLLREEIDDLRRSIRLHDIVGGIGYIAGLTGLWFYLKARRSRSE